MTHTLKVCIASSIGGHLHEILQLRPVYEQYPHFYVVNDSLILPDPMRGKTYFIRHSERDLLVFWNLVEAFRILRRERPTHLISAGAGLAVPLGIVARVMGVRVLFIETFAAITQPTVTGRLMYYLAHEFLYQWAGLRRFYPKARYAGKIFGFRERWQRNAAV